MRRASLGVAVVTLSLVYLFTPGRPVTPSAGTVHYVDAAPTSTTIPEASTTTAPPPPETTTVPEPVTELTTVAPKVTQPPTPRSSPVQTTVAAPASTGGGSCGGSLPPCAVLARESGGDPTVYNSEGSGASGRWQIMPGTWGNYDGYANAADAPVSVQDERAAQIWAGGSGCSAWQAC